MRKWENTDAFLLYFLHKVGGCPSPNNCAFYRLGSPRPVIVSVGIRSCALRPAYVLRSTCLQRGNWPTRGWLDVMCVRGCAMASSFNGQSWPWPDDRQADRYRGWQVGLVMTRPSSPYDSRPWLLKRHVVSLLCTCGQSRTSSCSVRGSAEEARVIGKYRSAIPCHRPLIGPIKFI